MAIRRQLVQGEITMIKGSDEGSIICATRGEDSDARVVRGEERRETNPEVSMVRGQRRREKQ
jgi:hypothetical protein